MSMKTKFGTLSLEFGKKSGLNTFKTCKIVKKWTLDGFTSSYGVGTKLT